MIPGKKMGPSGPRALLVGYGPVRFRYVLEVSISLLTRACNSGAPTLGTAFASLK